MLLWMELGEVRAQVAIALVAVAALALGLATVWPVLARLEAIAAMLGLPVLAVGVALRKSVVQDRWLRRAVFAVGGASALLAVLAALATLFPSDPLGTVWLNPDGNERTVTSAADAAHVTLTVRAPARGADQPLRLAVGRGGFEREVRMSLEAPLESTPSLLDVTEPIVERRVAVAVPGRGPLRVRWLNPLDDADDRIEVTVRSTSLAARHVVLIGGLLAAVGFVLQVLAERRRARSWLLLGSWFAIGFAMWAPTAWDPSQPGWTALGALLFAVMAGGGGAAVVSYLIARRYAVSERH